MQSKNTQIYVGELEVLRKELFNMVGMMNSSMHKIDQSLEQAEVMTAIVQKFRLIK